MEIPHFSFIEGIIYSLYALYLVLGTITLVFFMLKMRHHAIRVRLPWFSVTSALAFLLKESILPLLLIIVRFYKP